MSEKVASHTFDFYDLPPTDLPLKNLPLTDLPPTILPPTNLTLMRLPPPSLTATSHLSHLLIHPQSPDQGFSLNFYS